MPEDDDARVPDETALYRDELDRLREAAGELRHAYHDLQEQVQRVRRQAAEAEQRYERLRSHVSVRALLKAAQLSRPLRSRAAAAGSTDGTGRQRADVAPAPAPAEYRARLRGRLVGETGSERLHVAVAGRGAGALAASLQSVDGWRVDLLARSADGLHDCPPGCDVVVICDPEVEVAAMPAHPVRVAVVGTEPGEWLRRGSFDDLDLVLAAGEEATGRIAAGSAMTASVVAGAAVPEALREALLAWTEATRVALSVATPDREVAEWWGDTHFGRAVQRQLERHGHPTRLYMREDYSSPDLVRADVALHVFGLAAPRPQAAQVNVLWGISHPERITPERCEAYDLVLVASERFAAHLTPMVRPPVLPLAQATDPERFTPEATGPAHDLLFVGNSRRRRRTILDDLTPTPYDLAVYGGDWTPDLLDPRYLRGEVVPNAELHRYYASAKIVLNDHWPEMARLGFVSNRIYDALAAGAMVISDEVEGLQRAFDGAVPTYRGRDELRALVDGYLADPPARRELAERGRAAVLERHTFAHRVERLLELVQPFLTARRTSTGAR